MSSCHELSTLFDDIDRHERRRRRRDERINIDDHHIERPMAPFQRTTQSSTRLSAPPRRPKQVAYKSCGRRAPSPPPISICTIGVMHKPCARNVCMARDRLEEMAACCALAIGDDDDDDVFEQAALSHSTMVYV